MVATLAADATVSASAGRPASSKARAFPTLASDSLLMRVAFALAVEVSRIFAAASAWLNRSIAVSSICGVVSGVPYWIVPSGWALLNGTPEQ